MLGLRLIEGNRIEVLSQALAASEVVTVSRLGLAVFACGVIR